MSKSSNKTKPVEKYRKKFKESVEAILELQDHKMDSYTLNLICNNFDYYLDVQKEKFVEMGEGLKKEDKIYDYAYDYAVGYNQAVEDYQEKIKSDSLEGEGENV